MPEHFRSLIVILVLATIIFAFAFRTVSAISGEKDFARRRNMWLVFTTFAFLSNNFWVYVVVVILFLAYYKNKENNPVALYFLLLLLLPVAYMPIPGMGLTNYIFNLSHARLLAIFILLAMWLKLRKQPASSDGRVWPDRLQIAFLLLSFLLYFRSPVISEVFRYGMGLFLDAYLPYFVISRALRKVQHFRDALFSLILAIMIVAALAIFELQKQWLLYGYILQVLDLTGGMTEYLGRDGILRALVTAGQPIALGYVMVVGLGIYLYLQRSIQQKFIRWAGMLLLIAGLIAPLSRGPWVGACVLLFVFFILGRRPLRNLMAMSLAGVIALSLASVLPGGERVINLLPFIGAAEKANIEYRERLISNSLIVIQRSPWFGDSEFRSEPEMEAMRQGQGIIDVVNTYLAITLSMGLVGLGLFIAFFLLVLSSVFRAMRSIQDRSSEEYLLGQALFSTLVAILVIIFSVSSITIIPIVYWSVAGLGIAYAQMVRKAGIPSDKASKLD